MSGAKTLSENAKAQDILLKSFQQAFKSESDKYLILVGDGPLRTEAQDLAESLGISSQTCFLGNLPEPWIAYKAADLFCFPSRYEGLPNVLPEAASCGLPILASDIPEVRTLSAGKPWILKQVDDIDGFSKGLNEIYLNIEYWKKEAIAVIPEIQDQFSMVNCALRYIDEYQSLLE
jgi:glycosyltransferase involved in cell wall biosynthesis